MTPQLVKVKEPSNPGTKKKARNVPILVSGVPVLYCAPRKPMWCIVVYSARVPYYRRYSDAMAQYNTVLLQLQYSRALRWYQLPLDSFSSFGLFSSLPLSDSSSVSRPSPRPLGQSKKKKTIP